MYSVFLIVGRVEVVAETAAAGVEPRCSVSEDWDFGVELVGPTYRSLWFVSIGLWTGWGMGSGLIEAVKGLERRRLEVSDAYHVRT